MFVLVLGARGMLGWDIVKQLSWHNIPHIAVDRDQLDICNELQFYKLMKFHKFSHVVNCAAYTDVPACENNVAIAKMINALALRNISEICSLIGVGLIHFSTDFVFDGMKCSPYTEADIPNPLNVYGESKLQGEQIIVENCKDYKILRLQWLYGLRGNNFIKKVLLNHQKRGLVDIIDDQFGCPCSAEFVSYVVSHILGNWNKIPSGIYHTTHDNYCSWYDYAKNFTSYFGIDGDIYPISSKEVQTKVIRPNYSVMSNEKLKTVLDIEGSDNTTWQSDLNIFMKHYGRLLRDKQN